MRYAAGWISQVKRKADATRQRKAIEEYCQENDMTVTEWIGGTFGEVAFGDWLNGKKVDVVVVASSGLVSDDVFTYYAYKSVLKRRHCELEATVDEITPGYRLYGKILDTLVDRICEVELANEPIRKPHDRRDKIARGAYIGGNAPMGYKVENGKLVMNPDELPVVEFIMEQKRQGKTMLGTVEALNAKGYKTRRGGPFVISTVQSIWHNEPFYRGMYRIGKDGDWVNGQHEAILKD
jgi:site-specific DNA recombinase